MLTPGSVLGAARSWLDSEPGAEEHESEDGQRVVDGLNGVHEVEVACSVGDAYDNYGEAERDTERRS
ncbi:hypothetical protein ACLQ8T_13625 [Glutamicibacter sp. FR1]|uniref:hypothetical protein n=1 Tax=Glutamicibacter sp. FR1 TaxID=3393744 RepID=UPI0039AF5994